MRLKNKIAVVTGAGSGMGAAMARRFCEEGAQVIAVDVSGKQVEVADSIGAACISMQTDVSKTSDIQAMLGEAINRFGRLDVLCNNAGIQGPIAAVHEYAEEDFERVLTVNLGSVFLGLKYAVPLMRKNGGGSIINTSSIAAISAFPNTAGYSASKAGVSMLTKMAAVECAADGIRVNAILPGAIDTGMTRGELDPENLASVVRATLIGRIGQPEEIASLALFLASDESAFITGKLTPIDGGYTLP